MRTSAALDHALDRAHEFASRAGADSVTPAHLLAGLAATDCLAREALVRIGIDVNRVAMLTDMGVAGAVTGDLPLSVTARSALEFARAQHPASWRRSGPLDPPESLYVALLEPLRTGHVLLGLLAEGSVTALVPELETTELRAVVKSLLKAGHEMPERWSTKPRFLEMPDRVRDVLNELDEEEVHEPETIGRDAYRELAATLDALPNHRRAQAAIGVWQNAKQSARRRIESMSDASVRELTARDIEALLADALDQHPTVVRARKWLERIAAKHPEE